MMHNIYVWIQDTQYPVSMIDNIYVFYPRYTIFMSGFHNTKYFKSGIHDARYLYLVSYTWAQWYPSG